MNVWGKILCRRKNGTDVSKVASLTGRYKEIAEERKFVIEKTDAADAGTYECWVDSLKEGATFNVYGNHYCENLFYYGHTYILLTL